jgi:hypothetical protein
MYSFGGMPQPCQVVLTLNIYIMKKIILLLFGLSVAAALDAQHESLFGRSRVVGAFGAPIVEVGFRNNLNTSIGGGGGLVINNLFLGAYGLGSLDFRELLETGQADRLEIGHGGLWLGFTVNPHSLIHLYGSGRIGWGAVNVSFRDNAFRYREIDKIFVATPEIGLELNITRWLRASGAIGYRHVQGVSGASNYTNEDFSGTVATFAVRIGWFGNRRMW